MMVFHSVCGERITFHNDNTIASRNISDFSDGLVFSKEPLPVNTLFQIKIEKKIYTWSGGLEFGVTKCDPDYIVVPTNATDLKHGTWILSGSSVLKDDRSLLDIYALNLNTVDVGDVVGVMRTDQDELVFSLNGELKGVAAYNIPKRVFAVVDLYGQVSCVSVVQDDSNILIVPSMSNELLDIDNGDESESEQFSSMIFNFDDTIHPLAISRLDTNHVQSLLDCEKLRFHSKCGSLAKVSCNARAAERLRPLDEFNNGVVMTHRPLLNDELFEIRIDRLVEKWSGSIEVGVTTHNPDLLTFPPTMTNLKTGTIMMSGCGILTNGKATMRDYGDFNLDELMIGDRIGLIRKCNGNLHYVINGLDQGCAASNAPELVWGVVDLYGRTVKVTIVEKDEKEEQNLVIRRNTVLRNGSSLTDLNAIAEDADDRLSFHTRCGAHAAVINNNRTAYRPNSFDDFNNGVVITHRPLKRNEVFEVRLDKIITKWAGSIEIGVTTHSPTDIEYPSTMTNIRSGTWMMTGNGVMHNGTTVIDDYGTNLDKLQIGDRVAVVVKDNGSLHFFVNGIDQGEAACNLPTNLYGVIDLYGQAAQATIVDYDLICCCNSPSEAGFPSLVQNHIDLHFHHIHGKNVRICNGGRTAVRPYGYAEFTDSVVIANRPLKTNEIFALRIEKIVDKWSGSLEIGVTVNRPDDFELPTTIRDLEQDIWLLTGSTIMQNGEVIKHEYNLNLDTVTEGMIIGLMRHSDKTLHFYLDEVDQGEACTDVPPSLYPIVDLYGQCAQVCIVSPPEHKFELPISANNMQTCLNWIDDEPITSGTLIDGVGYEDPLYSRGFYGICGRNITLRENDTVATRDHGHEYGIVFSKITLKVERIFQVRITRWSAKYAGYISIGVTTTRVEKSSVPASIALLTPDIWYLLGDEVWHNGRLLKSQYCHDLHWLQVGSLLGVKRTLENTLHFYINGQDQGVAVRDLPQDVYVVVDLYGSTTGVMITKETSDTSVTQMNRLTSLCDSFISTSSDITQESDLDDLKLERAKIKYYLTLNEFQGESSFVANLEGFFIDRDELLPPEMTFFTELRGRNIRLLNNNITAVRVESYNQGLVIISKPLPRNTLFQVVIDNLNLRWVSSLFIGILCHPLLRSSLPTTALGFKKDAWFFGDDSVYHNGNKIKSRYGLNLERLLVNQRVGVLVDSDNQLRLFIDEVDQGVAASHIPPMCFVIIDLYGQCEQISVVNSEPKLISPITEIDNVQDNDNEINSGEDLFTYEKADLEHHEKESPSDEQAVVESRMKLDKIRENLLTCFSSISFADVELDCKSVASTENLSRLNKLGQTIDMSATNCDHKTNLNIANVTCIQAEKSKTSPLTRSLTTTCLSPSSSTPVTTSTINKKQVNLNCEYITNCLCLRSHLGIPNEFFLTDNSVVCYCKTCCLNSATLFVSKTSCKKGDQSVSSSSAFPIGWCKFPIKTRPITNKIDYITTEKWHVAFVVVSFAVIRKILDAGRFSVLETSGIFDKKMSIDKSAIRGESNIIMSPSMAYVTNCSSSLKYKYKDRSTNIRYQCTAAFQVLCNPEAYRLQPASHNNETTVLKIVEGDNFNKDDVTIISALLLKMERL